MTTDDDGFPIDLADSRRSLLKKGIATAGVLGLGVGESVASRGGDGTGGRGGGQEAPDPGRRIRTGTRVSPRDFITHNYERIFTHRKKEALEALLADPEVNRVARNWIASFEAHEPLTNYLDMIGVQGPRDMRVSGGFGPGFEVTAVDRQTVYGIVDRRSNELLALQINAPASPRWTESYDDDQQKVGRFLVEQPEVSQHLAGNEWYPVYKSTGGGFTAFRDFPHGEVGVALFQVRGDDGVFVVSTYVTGTPEDPQLLKVARVDEFVRYPPHEIAHELRPNARSVLGEVPEVPFEKRPWYIANDGYHRIERPPKTLQQNGWRIRWSPPVTQGIVIQADYAGKPVFAAMDSPTTFTGYYLPPRRGRNTSDWYFPRDRPVFSGSLLFWDVHAPNFGGPGIIGKIDYPQRDDHPAGFRMRTHYHTGAFESTAIDFHSGFRFGPYNYDISYEFFDDGELRPIWRRMGPGYVTEYLAEVERNPDYGRGEGTVVQHYTSAQAMDVTPGTTEGVRVQYFDGDAWRTPNAEFYREGEPGTIVRFTNPNGPETVDIPLTENEEIVVVRKKPDEIGPGEDMATRLLDPRIEAEYYHPSQYVDGENIQGQRVVAWLLLEAATGQMPHPAGVTSFARVGNVELSGY